MRFFSSSALASAPKLRFAASCSAAETMTRSDSDQALRSCSKSLLAHAFSTSLFLASQTMRQRPAVIWGSGGRFACLFLLRGEDRDRPAGLLDRGDRGLGGAPDRERHLGLEFAH